MLLRQGDCGRYVQDLIDKVAEQTGNPFVSDYAPDLFDTISGQGGVAFRPADPNRSETGGTVSGSIKGGDATIIITPQPSGPGFSTARNLTPYGLRLAIYDYVRAGLHETIHLAGYNKHYTDKELALAAHALNPKSWLPENGQGYSDSFDAELAKHCTGPKE